ncbi:MAG: phospholipid carrier-dependent glycosyltransferase [Steroidobacterales bacterium]
MSAAHFSTQRRTLALLLLGLLLWFLPLSSPALFHPDEGRYGEVPREMLASGDWVTPRLDAIKYFEKPPLQYWTTAAAFALFGAHEWTVRLWPALTALFGVVLTWLLARHLYDTATALMAAAIQAGSLLYMAMSRLAVLDMGLCFSLQLALTGLMLLVRRRADRADGVGAQADGVSVQPDGAGAPLLLGIGLSLAMLSKGLIGILIPAAVAAIYMLCFRDWSLPWRARPWWAIGALALIAAPWFVLVAARNPEFTRFFFVHEHFERFLTRVHRRYEPAWFFVPVLAMGLLPWATLLPYAVRNAWRDARRGDRGAGLLLIWSGFIFAFFSASQSKLIPYILPIVPALALLLARALRQLDGVRAARHLRAVAAGALLLAIVLALLPWVPAASNLLERASRASCLGFALALSALALCALGAAILHGRGRGAGAVVTAAIGAYLFCQIGFAAAAYLPQQRAIAQFVPQARMLLTASTPIYCVQTYIQPLTFYLRRPCTLVDYRGELDFGLQQEPWRAIADLQGFAARWSAGPDALAIVDPEALARLAALGVRMRVIYTSPSFVAVVRQ